MDNLVNGVLLIYNRPLFPAASMIMDHINAIEQYSRFKVWTINSEFGFPSGLRDLQYRVIVLHYSLFGVSPFSIDEQYRSYLSESDTSYKIAFFQDEYRFWSERIEILNRFQVDCVYTCIQPEYYNETYSKFTQVPRLRTYLPGYVSEEMVEMGMKASKPNADRTIDVGYRGRSIPFYHGRGSQEKVEIGKRFKEGARGLGLKIDIETYEDKRLYGKKWYKFLGDCRAVLGVEAGVSVVDIEDTIRHEYERLVEHYQTDTFFDEGLESLISSYEDNIYYRTISPRHFEAAASRTCQILYEGRYSGILRPMVHYIPLKKDWSNFDEVIHLFRDNSVRRELTENSYRDLIASGHYSYQQHIKELDKEFHHAGMNPCLTDEELSLVSSILGKNLIKRKFRVLLKTVPRYPFPGRKFVVCLISPVLSALRKVIKIMCT